MRLEKGGALAKSHTQEFVDALLEELKNVEREMDTTIIDGKRWPVRTARNTALFAKALSATFAKRGGPASHLIMTAACDYSALESEE